MKPGARPLRGSGLSSKPFAVRCGAKRYDAVLVAEGVYGFTSDAPGCATARATYAKGSTTVVAPPARGVSGTLAADARRKRCTLTVRGSSRSRLVVGKKRRTLRKKGSVRRLQVPCSAISQSAKVVAVRRGVTATAAVGRP